MLTSVIQIDDLNRAGEILLGDVPDPFGAVADDNLLFGAAPAALPDLDVESFSEPLGILDGSGVSSGVGVANGIAFFVPSGFA